MNRIINTSLLLALSLSLSSCAALMKKNAENDAQMSAKALNESDPFLVENSKKAGVKVTPSGLQYLVLNEGSGPQPKETDTVKVHYRGTLTNGAEFDSSYKRGEPATFPLNRVIKGWTEGVQLMKTGSKYRFFIPSRLAYGENGAGLIPGNSTLIFDVELLAIE